MLLSKIKKDTVGKNVELMLCYSYLISIVIKYNQNSIHTNPPRLLYSTICALTRAKK